MKNVAVILAAGVGRRLGLDKPKQFLKISGKMIIEHTVDVFENHDMIDEIAIVAHPIFTSNIEDLVLKNKWQKVKKILNGGAERYLSSLSAIEAYSHEENVNLIFHDSVRPLVSARVISEVIDKLRTYDAVDVVVSPVDTIVEVNGSGKFIVDIPNRNNLRRGQTPQGFRMEIIRSAYALAMQDPHFHATDDCGILLKYKPDSKIAIVIGDECNIKLTNPEDIYVLDKLFQLKYTNPKECDLNELSGKVIVVFGGNSGIGKDIADIAGEHGALVDVYSRSTTNTDVSSLDDIKFALDKTFKEKGRIDYVINTAAILNKEPLLNLTKNEIRSICEINYLGAVNTTIASFEYLRATKGQILQFTSSSYTRGRAYYAMYSSSKSAVVNFVQAMAEEWSNENIRINCINPQRTKTPMRVKNFGIEDEKTLLSSRNVADVSLNVLLNNFSGEVVDIKLSY